MSRQLLVTQLLLEVKCESAGFSNLALKISLEQILLLLHFGDLFSILSNLCAQLAHLSIQKLNLLDHELHIARLHVSTATEQGSAIKPSHEASLHRLEGQLHLGLIEHLLL